VGRERIIERERRWAVPAAIVAVAPLVLYIISVFIVQSAGIVGGSSEADQLASLHDHSGAVLISSIVRGIGFALLVVPMFYLFLAAMARNTRVRAAMIGFVFIGPLLFGAQGIIQAVGAGQAASDFVDMPPEPTRTYPQFQDQVKNDSEEIEKVTIYAADNSLEVEQTNGDFYGVEKFSSDDESKLAGDLNAKGIETETDSDTGTGPPDALATHVTDENGVLQASQGLLVPSVLGLIVMMIYLPLQALRAGLIPRFLGSIGIALGASMILILPIAVLAMLAWVGFLGLTFVGKVPGGLPPAWEAGEAIPWPSPGDRAPTPKGDGGGDTIEGEGTEVDDEGEGGTEPSSPRPQKRKRKQRD
jgi:hypothetical protein